MVAVCLGAFLAQTQLDLKRAAAMLPESVTVMLKLVVHPAQSVEIPEITPALLRLKPGGKLPEETAQVYGGVPPVAVSVAE